MSLYMPLLRIFFPQTSKWPIAKPKAFAYPRLRMAALFNKIGLQEAKIFMLKAIKT